MTGSDDTTVRVWSPLNGTTSHTYIGKLFSEVPITCLSHKPGNDDIFVVGNQEGKVSICRVSQNRILRSFTSHKDSIESIAFSKFLSDMIITASLDGLVCVMDEKTGKNRLSLKHDVCFFYLQQLNNIYIYIYVERSN